MIRTLELPKIAYLLRENKAKCIDNANPISTTKKIRRIVLLKNSSAIYGVLDRSLKHLQLIYISKTNRLHVKASVDLELEGDCNNLSERDMEYVDKVFTFKSFIDHFYSHEHTLEYESLAYENNTLANLNLGRLSSIFLRDKYIAIDMYQSELDPNYRCKHMSRKAKTSTGFNNPYLKQMKEYNINVDRICEVAYEVSKIIKKKKIKLAASNSERYKQSTIVVDRDLSVTIYEEYIPINNLLIGSNIDLGFNI